MTAPVTYIENWIAQADHLYSRLANELAWERRENTPRSEYWTNLYDRPYTYGKDRGQRTYQPRPSHEIIDAVRDHIVIEGYGILEGCFLNHYLDGTDALGPHSDDDPGIDHRKPIAVVTLGQARDIAFREILVHETETAKAVYGEYETLKLGNGSLLLMHPGMQFTHQHKIPKGNLLPGGKSIGPRISMTYRGLLTS